MVKDAAKRVLKLPELEALQEQKGTTGWQSF